MTPETADITDTIWDVAAGFVDRQLHDTKFTTAAFDEWITRDPRHRIAYDTLMRVARDAALNDALAAFDTPPAVNIAAVKATRRRFMAGGIMAAAAVAVAAFLLPPVVYDQFTPLSVYETEAGQPREVRLSDGTDLHINGASRVEARITPYRRHVRLSQGEAYFAVAKDADRPFTVALDGGDVRVLGTQFNLSYMPDGVELNVYEGKVRLKGNDRKFGLFTRGMRARLADGAITPLAAFDPDGGDWRAGWIEPDNWSLERVAQEFTRRSGVAIRFENAALKDKRIIGRLRLDDPQSQLETLAVVHGFEVARENGSIIIR
ncbi:FecR domain-containing protein [Asticcacaulis sp. SL142]|uniref:FecR family protein n=1 Tax=Asticcacaulis sp. SL142 TaxID=2995155 RepID=UPI00226C9884|nr:FecR domain-containing protein [Asticcacaulis sp. SL142]WAC48303.1 FecR domain-containing protein [Asticcacaulis sp. SL142]